MNRKTSPFERIRAVVLAVVVVISVVGGAAAITGQTAADGTLADETGGDSTDVDTDRTLDGSTAEETTSGARSTGDGETATTVADGETTTNADDGKTTTNADDSGSSGGDATPGSVGITAGATDQPPIYAEDEGPAALTLEEDQPGSFPDSGTATLRLPDDAGVSFDTANTSATASGDGATATVTDVTATEVTVAVSSTDGSANSSVSVEGLRFASAADAGSINATWTFGPVSDATAVEPERLRVQGGGNDLARGAHQVPNGGERITIDDRDGRTEGYHAADETLVVSTPDRLEGEIEFDTTASVDVIAGGGDCASPIIPDPTLVRGVDYTVNETQIRIDPSCELGSDEYVRIEDVRFNVSGAGVADPAEITAQLETTYEPVDAVERVPVDAGDPVDGHAPAVDAATTTVEAGSTNATGDGAVTVSIADDVGGLTGEGTQITVESNDPGVGFDESQELEAVAVSGDTASPTVVSVNATTVVLEAQADSQQGDEFRLQRAGGGGIRFDVGTGAGDASMLVSTTPGAEDVTQSTGTAVTVTGQDCRSIPRAVAGADGVIDNADVLTAIDYWEDDEKVPGTCGARMTEGDVQEVVDIWEREDSRVGES